MEKNNKEEMNCIICFGFPVLPVATPCGHIFCWDCLKSWLANKPIIECPVCKNGFEMSKVIKLHAGNDSKANDDRPKPEYQPGVANNERSSFTRNILNAFGFYGAHRTENLPLPTEKEVLMNRLSLVVFVLGVCLVIFVFNS